MILFWISLFVTGSVAQLEQGDICGPNKDRICALAKDCPEAVKEIKAKRSHSLAKCGWQGKDEIVCCTKPEPKPESKPEPKPGSVIVKYSIRKSTSECIKYWNEYQVDYTPLIVNGYNASVGEFPHMAALGFAKDSNEPISWGHCGGSLISTNFVLSAAHCLLRADGARPVMVRLGKVDLTGDEDKLEPQDIKIIETIPHHSYKHFDKLHDIALLRLEKDVELTKNVRPFCLYVEENIADNTSLTISGWGQTNTTGATSRFLLRAYVKSVDIDSCNQSYATSALKKPLFHSHLCALSPEEYPSDTCPGDSGGPIQITNRKDNNESPFIIVGVTSFGKGCGGPTPSVYTKVSYYLDWIEGIVWP